MFCESTENVKKIHPTTFSVKNVFALPFFCGGRLIVLSSVSFFVAFALPFFGFVPKGFVTNNPLSPPSTSFAGCEHLSRCALAKVQVCAAWGTQRLSPKCV